MASIIDLFFQEIDRKWDSEQNGKVRLNIIGSSAIMLQTKYSRGTKDSDVLEMAEIGPEIKRKLTELGGKGSKLHDQFRFYLDFVNPSLPFLPQKPHFLKAPSLKRLKCFEVFVLDLVDVVVSKLKRFNANDVSDIRALVMEGVVDHKKLVKRFNEAVDCFSTDARAEDLPRYVKNLNTVERDFLDVPESDIELPHWIGGR